MHSAYMIWSITILSLLLVPLCGTAQKLGNKTIQIKLTDQHEAPHENVRLVINLDTLKTDSNGTAVVSLDTTRNYLLEIIDPFIATKFLEIEPKAADLFVFQVTEWSISYLPVFQFRKGDTNVIDTFVYHARAIHQEIEMSTLLGNGPANVILQPIYATDESSELARKRAKLIKQKFTTLGISSSQIIIREPKDHIHLRADFVSEVGGSVLVDKRKLLTHSVIRSISDQRDRAGANDLLRCVVVEIKLP